LDVRGVNDIMQTEMHAAELLVPEPSSFAVEISTEKLKIYKSSGSDHIRTVLIQARGNTLRSEIHELINTIWSKEELPQQWNEFIIVPIYKNGDKTDCNNYR